MLALLKSAATEASLPNKAGTYAGYRKLVVAPLTPALAQAAGRPLLGWLADPEHLAHTPGMGFYRRQLPH